MTTTLSEDQLLIEKLRKRYEGWTEQEVRNDLRAKYAETWNDAELLGEFEVQQFDGPIVHVIRKIDKCCGTVGYISEPRLYFAFIED
jgi:hypothetical protein